MPEIGKSLVFYMHYYQEMRRLYAKEDKLAALENHTEHGAIMEKINAVGRAAGVEARVLLEACVSGFRRRVEAAHVVRLNAPMNKTIERNWQITFTILPLNKNARPGIAEVGLYIDSAGLFPWAWSRGGVAGEQRMRELLSNKVGIFGSKRFGWDGGSIGFAPVPVDWAGAKDFYLEADAVIEEANRRFDIITPDFVKALIV